MNPVSKKILVVDDEQAIAKALQLKLTTAGFTVSLAFNGKQALDLMNIDKFDLILLDLLMPELDGWSVLEQIKGKGQRVIITSNLSQSEDIKRAQELGAVDFIVKSDFSLADIVNKVSKALQ